MAAENAPSEIIERQRKELLNILQQDPDSILDTLASRRLISEEEYETLDKVTDPLKKSRKLLILVQKKGEVSCQYFLKCLLSTFPESATTWGLKHELLKHKDRASLQSISKNLGTTFSPRKEKNKNPEIKVSSKEKELLDLKTSAFSRDKKTSYQETALSSGELEKEFDTPKIMWPCSLKRVEYEIPATITYLKDGQRYEEPDDSLYLAEGEHPGSAGYTEDAETTVEEGDFDVPERIAHGGKEDSECSESMGFSDENISEASETSMTLEEGDKYLEERKKVFKDVLSCLNMDRNRKLLPDFVKQFSLDHGCRWTPETPADLAWNFLMKVQALDVTARDSILRRRVLDEDSKEELLTALEKLEIQDIQTINPLDVLCASMLCSDSSLQREVMSNMYQCHFALPLLLPDSENNKSILMLGAMKGIVKKQSTQSSGGPMGDSEKFLSLMKMPVISFVRLGHCSFSKSRILNVLLSPDQLKTHKIFLHHDLSVPALPRQISDGLVEITWCFPDSDDHKESPGIFQKPVAVTNLRGDLESFWTQFGLLVEVSSAMFFFADCLGKKEWDLLLLGEAVIQRCYFVLSPQARVSEEAQIFQRTLKLKPSQLLFWEEAGDKRKNMEGIQAALQEVMSSSLRCVSVEDMASLARELGIQVDQDLENAQGIQVFPNVNMTGTAQGEGQRRYSQPKNSFESQALRPMREPGVAGEVNQNFQNFNHSPVFASHLENAWPSPNRIGNDFDRVSLESPWVMGSHSGSEQRSKWFCASSFWNSRSHKKGQGLGNQYSQPQRFYSGGKFITFSSTSWKHPLNRTLGRPPRLSSQSVWACPERPQTMGVLEKFGAVVSVVGRLHSLGSQLAGPAGKTQPGQAQAPGTKLTEVTGKFTRTASPIKDPHPPCFRPTGNTQKLVRPASQQGKQMMAQGGSLDSVFQTGSHPASKSRLLPSSQFISHQPKPSQVKHFQPKSSQPGSSQARPFQTKAPRPQPSHPKPSQPRPIQPKSSQTHPSQTRAYQQRAGPQRVGKR
uniref:Caspase recruitment domain family member 6 n=1 Tax=Sciurus vulgaris TaxID=55149 RepID=A0A8D2ATM0_SCIVU